MKKLSLVFFVLLACISIDSYSQNSIKKKIDVNHSVDIVKVYEQVGVEGYGTPFIYERLANAYYFKNDYRKAKEWYEKLFEEVKPTDATLKYRYKQSLKALDLEVSPNEYLSVSGSAEN